MIRLTYIWHDCFVVSSGSATIIFDYSSADGIPQPPLFPAALRTEVPLYVIVSHFHKDHFDRSIFKWRDAAASVRFIVSRDVEKHNRHLFRENTVYKGVKPYPGQAVVLRPGEKFDDGVVAVSAYDSTDTGNSYMVTLEGMKIFHAGDLNAWVWKDESTAAEVEAAVRDFDKIINEIARFEGTRIDVAMFPVDSRLGRDYWEGAARFVRLFDVGVFVPMHFCLAEDAADADKKRRDAVRFEDYANPDRGIYVALQATGGCIAVSGLPRGQS